MEGQFAIRSSSSAVTENRIWLSTSFIRLSRSTFFSPCLHAGSCTGGCGGRGFDDLAAAAGARSSAPVRDWMEARRSCISWEMVVLRLAALPACCWGLEPPTSVQGPENTSSRVGDLAARGLTAPAPASASA